MSTAAGAPPGLRKPSISAVSNSPPPPPPSALGRLLRRRRRSDLLLAAIGALICLVSGFHIALHSRHVHAGPGAPGAGHAVRAKLDGFQDGAGRLSRRMERMKRLGGRRGGGERRVGTPDAGATVVRNVTEDGPRTGTKSEPSTSKIVDEPPETKVNPQAKLDADRQKGPKKAEARRGVPGGPSDGPMPHPVAHLSCHDHGGPSDEKIVDEMVFWSDVPSDADYLSPMHPSVDPRTDPSVERYLSFEPDHGGWNNIRMAMETALVMGHATGRTLVLPPEQRMYLIDKGAGGQQTTFGFNDFFHLDAISIEHKGFKVITMDEFLAREGVTGRLQDYNTNRTVYPPQNKTDYGSGNSRNGLTPLWKYLRQVGNTPTWDPWECALAIPSSTDDSAVAELKDTVEKVMAGKYGGKPKPTLEEFNGRPVPVDAPLGDRMREMLADRPGICVYDRPLQEARLLHLKVDKGVRLLTHFYAFVFFADWRQDLWSKRFVRDHLRYVDDIMCAAARVIERVREHARGNTRHEPSRLGGVYDAAHIRRGDFQYPPTQLPAEKLYELSKAHLTEGATLYVATDERNKEFFEPFRKKYDLVFLDDFLGAIPGVNTNYYGMIDQLVAYKSRVFYGTWWSTLSGYVNRMRGYYIAKHGLEGHEDGTMLSWYFTPSERVEQMRSYIPVRKPIYCREFPTSWRDIDKGIDEIAGIVSKQ